MGIGKSTVVKYLDEVGLFFEQIAPLYIQLPDAADLPRLATQIGAEQAVLFVDGMLTAIQRPDHAGDDFYCGRGGKCRDSLNVQVVCDCLGVIREVITGMPGRMHDKTALLHSGVFQAYLNNLPNGYVVLGDSAYQGFNQVKLRVPYHGVNLNQLTRQQRQYNKLHSSLRSVVERVNLCLQVEWRILQMKECRLPAKTGVTRASQLILAAAVLHNRFTNFIS
jgi:hypothetical protein